MLVARSLLGGEFTGGESAWWRGDWIPIQYLILLTNIIRIVWLTVRRITNLIWELKG